MGFCGLLMLLSNKTICGMWPAKKHGNWSCTGGPAFALSAADSRGWLSAPLAESLRPDHLRQHVHNMHAWLPVSRLKNSYWCYCIIYSGNQLYIANFIYSGSFFHHFTPAAPVSGCPKLSKDLLYQVHGCPVTGRWGGSTLQKDTTDFRRIWFCRLLWYRKTKHVQ